ncbi:MAG: PAS domain S-box protein [Nitrospirae bacterium]|nr:PAS domain S-box protein [Nitrospirota bacterium]
MKVSLKTKVMAVVTAAAISISLVGATLFIHVYKGGIEKEIIARGDAMVESLARGVADGLAAENLEFIRKVSDIVHAEDVDLAQVYTSLWQTVDAYPFDRLNELPDPAAISHFKTNEAYFHSNKGLLMDFYAPIFYKTTDQGPDNKNILIGYARLRLSTEQSRRSMQSAFNQSILVSVLITLVVAVALDLFFGRYVLRPIMQLHESVLKHIEGEFPESVPVYSGDEIGELSSEFNRMSLALKEREERLADEKERLAVTLRSIGDAVIVTDIDGKITLINRVAERHTGWTFQEAVGKHLPEVFNIINEKTRERCMNPIDEVLRTGIITGLANHTALIRRDGTEIIIEDSAAPIKDRNSVTIGVVLVFRDVTEKQWMEKEIARAEKLKSVGLLAGGIAHDFNNILTSIVGNISIAKMQIDSQNKAHARLDKAEQASQRASELAYRLLTFARGGEPVRRTESIVDILKESASLVLSGSSIAAEFVVSGDICNIDIDAGQMSQVFNNLIINAAQAMPGGGKIVFSVDQVMLRRNMIPGLEEGTYVKISVSDTGTGIEREDIPRIFDPYFTTKEKGSGLGLASVYSIIQKHGGHITVESTPGVGTTFHIYLLALGSEDVCGMPEEKYIAAGEGKVLLMDDESMVRDIAGDMLSTLGYEVDLAADGEEAIKKYREALEANKRYDIVIMDLTIPGGTGGKETMKKLLAIDPDVKAVVSSGYSNDPVMSQYQEYGFSAVITKPYTVESFSRTIHNVLNES